jgi:hypothetical protein
VIASHLPSNVLLLLVPFMPSPWAAAVMLVARFCISQMDVPARQTYVNMVNVWENITVFYYCRQILGYIERSLYTPPLVPDFSDD